TNRNNHPIRHRTNTAHRSTGRGTRRTRHRHGPCHAAAAYAAAGQPCRAIGQYRWGRHRAARVAAGYCRMADCHHNADDRPQVRLATTVRRIPTPDSIDRWSTMTDSHRRHEPGNTVESPDGDRSSTSRQSLLLSTMAALATAMRAVAAQTVIKDTTWFGHILFVTLMIGATGWGLRRWRIPPPVVPFVQALVLLLLLTGLFTANGLAGFVPGPAAVDELHTLL